MLMPAWLLAVIKSNPKVNFNNIAHNNNNNNDDCHKLNSVLKYSLIDAIP